MIFHNARFSFVPSQLALILSFSTLLLSGCGGGSGSSPLPPAQEPAAEPRFLGLPAGLTLSMVDTHGLKYYAFNTDSETLTDLNALADASSDSAVQALRISDASLLGSFLQWPDFRVVNAVEKLDGKYLLMKPAYQAGTAVIAGTADNPGDFTQLTHFHDTELAAHSDAEFYGADSCTQADQDAGTCSGKYYGMQRLNAFVAEQNELEAELAGVLPQDQTLCRAYVDPYQKFELEQATAEETHAHGDLMHFALTESGRIYFYTEGENGLQSAQGFVALNGLSSENPIMNCARTAVSRVSEEGILVFVPETQKLYLVDSHGGDFHQHSQWDLADLLPQGVTVDLMAILGEGSHEEHAHE
ncbi:MAG: hypothetical protein JXR44_00570 [Thiotrichales bacterium]|nr:hypothetical protein [Thiotrichales bacterium]